MHPVRLHYLLTLAVNNAGLDPPLTRLVFLRAVQQLKERYPLIYLR